MELAVEVEYSGLVGDNRDVDTAYFGASHRWHYNIYRVRISHRERVRLVRWVVEVDSEGVSLVDYDRVGREAVVCLETRRVLGREPLVNCEHVKVARLRCRGGGRSA